MRDLPLGVWKYALAYALMLSGTSMIALLAGLIGFEMAPSEDLASLPIAIMIVGLAVSTVIVSSLTRRCGRKKVFIGFGLLAVVAALLASLSVYYKQFVGFCGAAYLVGACAASVQQYRFAAIEMVTIDRVPHAASCVLLGGILAAFIGPELALAGKDILAQPYSGAFLLLALLFAVGTVLLCTVHDETSEVSTDEGGGRPLSILLQQRVLRFAIVGAALAYGVMTFIMTATPISMHHHFHHDLEATKWVIQSHIAAMYLPSLVSASLIARFGAFRMTQVGIACYLVCLGIAYYSQGVFAFWLALVLLGVGWNFMFVSTTSLLPQTWQRNERYKVQASNDLCVFTTQALASLGSGWFLFEFRWHGIIMMTFVALVLATALLYAKRVDTA